MFLISCSQSFPKMKGNVKCAGIVRKSANLEEANGKIEGLLGKIQEKIDVMVEESLQ